MALSGCIRYKLHGRIEDRSFHLGPSFKDGWAKDTQGKKKRICAASKIFRLKRALANH